MTIQPGNMISEVPIRVGDGWATLFDISDGGARLEFTGDPAALPSNLEITLPNGQSVKMASAWSSRGNGDVLWCGASIAPLSPDEA